jgi:hypothetical protein
LIVAVVRSEKLEAEAEKNSGMSAIGNLYQATVREDREDFMRAVVTVSFGVCKFSETALLLVTFCKCSINLITKPNPIYNHSIT